MARPLKDVRSSQLHKLLQEARGLLETDGVSATRRLEASQARFNSDPDFLNLLAECYYRSGRTIDVLKTLDRVIEIGAATVETWSTTGLLMARVKEYAQSITAYQHALRLAPNDPSILHDYGKSLYEMGDVSNAAQQIERARELSDKLLPWQSLATMAPGNPDYSNHDVLKIRQQYYQKLSACVDAPARIAPKVVRRGRLRVGYLSSWFHRENYMKPVWGLINDHHRERIEVHLLTDSAGDDLPGYRPYPEDVVHETGDLDNVQLAEAIRSIGLDVLVDLNAYSTLSRLGLFLTPPAPVTAAWFNMYATSGFPGFHYVIGDEQTVIREEEPAYSERVARLPQSYLSFVVSHDAPSVVDPPCLKNGYITFGSLCSQYKITRPVLDAWTEILRNVATARLILGNASLSSACNRDYVREEFVERGIDAERLKFLGKAPHREFLGYYDSMDIALDAFPYNGGTTTMEAIWQGVPVITFHGDRWASRTSASILAGTHLAQFVASNVDGYIASAIELGNAPDVRDQLRQLRTSSREELLRSPACNTTALARAMEDLYFAMLSEISAETI